ncbi:peptidase [Staphylococcus sp. RIT622]|nr:peptidase [Staphylococcus sp. RIT622]
MKKTSVSSKLCMTGLSTALLMSTVGYNFVDVAHAKEQKDDKSQSKTQQQDNKKTQASKVNDSDLKKAVEDAKKAGVNVKQGNIQHHKVTSKNAEETQKKIQSDYQKQIDELEKATKKAKDDQEKYKKEVSEVKAYNDKQLKKYKDEVKKEKSTVDNGKKNPSKPKYGANINGDKGKYYTQSGSWHNLKSKTVDNDIHVNATGNVKSFKDLQNGNFAIHAYSDKKGKLSNDKIVQKVSWGNVKPKGEVVKGDKITEDMHKKVPGINKPAYNTSGKNNPFGKTTQLYSVKAGQWVTIPNAVHLANGKKKDLKVKFQKSGTKLDYGSNWVTFWNEGGSINYYDGTHDLSHTPPKDKITANYKVGDGKDKYLWTGATFDIDGGQALTMEDNNYAIVALGGGLKVDSNKVKKVTSAKPLGKTWGKDKGANLLNGTSSVPDGTAIFAKYDNVISHSVSNTGVKGSTLVANGDFGMHVNTSIAEYPKLKKEPKKPEPPKVQYNLQDMSINPTTKKSVSKKDVGYDKDYNYTLDYQLPVIKDNQESKKTKDEQNSSKKTNNENPKDEFNGKYENDYHTFTLGDDLPNELRIQKDKIKVTDDKGKDVTKEGDLKVDEKNQSFRWTPKKPSDFSEKKLKVTVASQVSSEADLKKWKKDNNTFEIPNTGYLELDGKTLPTNKVPVFVKKHVEPSAKKSVSKKDVDYDKNYNYTLDYQLPFFTDAERTNEKSKDKDQNKASKKTNNENPKDEFKGKYQNAYHTFTLGDDLPNELRIQKDKIKVTDDKGKDVTKEGDLKVDEKNQSFRWTPKKPSDFSEKKLKVTVASQVSSEADLKKWKKDNNTFEIPNTGYLELDGKTLPTNKVPVFVKKKVKSDIKKHILEDNQLKEHNTSDKGKDINYQLDYTLGNDKNYKKVSLKDDLEDVEDLKGVKVYLPKSQKDELSKKELSDIQNALKGTDTKQDDIKPESSEDKNQKDSNEDKKGNDQNEKTNKDTAQDEKAKNNDQSQKSSQKSESEGSDSQSSEQVKDDDKSNDNSSKEQSDETANQSTADRSVSGTDRAVNLPKLDKSTIDKIVNDVKSKTDLSNVDTSKIRDILKGIAKKAGIPTLSDSTVDKIVDKIKSKLNTSDSLTSKIDKIVNDVKSKVENAKQGGSSDNSSKDGTADNSKSDNTSKGDSTSKDDKTTKDDSADDSKSEGTTKDDNKDDSSSDATTKDDSSKAKDDSKTDDAQSSDAKPENGDLDITKLGDLNVDNEKESFEWTPKESKLLKGKKVKVLLTSKFKKDVDYKNFAKGEKYIVPNTSQIKYDDKTENSNKVDTEIPKPKKPENVVPPKKEEPKKPAPQPQKPTPPQKAEKPKKEEPKKDLPMTGTEKSIAGIIIGSILIGVAGLSTYIYKRRQS